MNGKLWLVLGIALIAVFIFVIFRQKDEAPPKLTTANNQNIPRAIRYLPLGDSYTIGESVSENQRWPNQLVKKLSANKVELQIADNPAVTGYTSQDLIDKELPLVSKLRPDFVTIQIGVNDYVQGGDATTFQKNLEYIIATVQKRIPQPGNIVLVTIPDYAKTPSGARYGDPNKSTEAITNFNKIITQVGEANSLPVADIFGASQQVVNNPELIAKDGLHPSAKQYGLWTDVIYKSIADKSLLKQ